jgi:hypothetical protein
MDQGRRSRPRPRQPRGRATYCQQGRIVESSTDAVFDDAAAAWWSDTVNGHQSLVVVDTAGDAAHVSTRRRVVNRDVWTVTGIDCGGSMHVRHVRRAAAAVLPAGYVTTDVVLGYVTTDAGAQGRTVDCGYVVVTASSVNWRLVGSADQFIQRLARSSASSSHQQPPHSHTATYQH